MRPSPPKILSLAETSGFLVTNLTNIRYLSGVEVSAGLLLVVQGRFFLFVDGRYIEAAKEHAAGNVSLRPLEECMKMLRKMRRCGLEENNVTLGQLRRLKAKNKNTKFIQKSDIIETFRRRKDAIELRHFRRAQRITRELLRRVPAAVRRETTERQLAHQLLTWAVELGADGLAFEPIVAFGKHTSRPHHHPTDRKLKRGHIIQIDVGARFRGYCADQSRVFFTAPPTAEQKVILAVLEKAKRAATLAVKAGASVRAPDEAARAVLRQARLEQYFTHAVGHGVGLEIHEGVSLSQKAPEQKLLRGEIVTIEPGIYLPGKFGMRIEDEVIVK